MTTGREQPLIRASEPARCAGTGADFNVIAIIIQKGAAYLCSVRMIQAFIGNRRVHGDLTVKNVFDIFDSYCIGKFENVFDIQHALSTYSGESSCAAIW